MIVLADLRWPHNTGIGRMAALYAAHRPAGTEILDLEVRSRIGSPFSPFAVSWAVRRLAVRNSVFWNPGFIPIFDTGVRSVVTVHDLTHLHFYSRLHRYYYNAVLRPLYHRADAIVCVSQHTRDEFIEWSGVSSTKVSVVYNSLSPGFEELAGVPASGRPYVFYAGNHRRYKNLENLIGGFAHSGLAGQGVELKMTGHPTPYLLESARKHGISDSVRYLGALSDAELVRSYKGASCVAFLSRYEGFGLPILEAMACSTPVIIANTSCLPEIAGDAAWRVSTDDLEEIGTALRCVVTEPSVAEDLRARGQRRLKAFDARKSAETLWTTIADVSAGRK